MSSRARDDKRLAFFTATILNNVVELGRVKHGDAEWVKESAFFHFRKSFGHVLKHYLEYFCIKHPDGDPHLQHALTRMAMGVYVSLDI